MNHNPSVYQLKLTVRKGKKVKLSNYVRKKEINSSFLSNLKTIDDSVSVNETG